MDQRTERREELADDEILTESDAEEINQFYQEKLDEGDSKIELTEKILFNLNAAMRGLGIYQGSDASPNSFNIEKAMLDNFDYRPVFVGEFTNPAEPIAGGIRVDSQVAYIDGDWFHVGKESAGAYHISDIDEIGMVEEGNNSENMSASELAVSVLGEMQEGRPSYDNSVKEAVLSPVYAGNEGSTLEDTFAGELELGNDIAWDTLRSIRDNESWRDTMAPLELAAAVANETAITDVVTASNEQGGFQIEVEKGE